MILKIFIFVLFKIATTVANTTDKQKSEIKESVVELTDTKWDQIQKGQWLVAFFDRDTKESLELEKHWRFFATKGSEFNINVAKVFAPDNPGLYVRFLVTVFPKVFYVKNGVAHEISEVNTEEIANLLVEGKLNKLKPVNFLSNPFSIQMSLLSRLFIHAVNLYNFENAIVQRFISAPSATDVVFGLTFIIVGTFLGLLMTCAFGLLQIFFMDSKESEEESDDKKHSDDDDEKEEKDKKGKKSSEKSSDVRKRK